MSTSNEILRSPQLLSRDTSALLVVDMQTKLLQLIPGHKRITFNIGRLIDGAQLFDISVAGTEQYPKGLGGTEPELAERLGEMPDKVRFSCGACGEVFEQFRAASRHQIVVVGIEAHVCILQTVLDLLGAAFDVFVAVDAIGSRNSLDHETALRRMELAGATLTTTESVLFEWCESSADPNFKAISGLIQKLPAS